MSFILQLKRLTQQELDVYTGVSGEIVVNQTTNELVLLDGLTPGGTVFTTDDRVRSKDYMGPKSQILYSRDGKIVDINNKPVNEMGVNVMQMLVDTALDYPNTGNWAYEEIPQIAASGIRHIRAKAVPMFARGDHQRYLDDIDGYWDRFKKVLDLCYNYGIGVNLTLVMEWQTIPNYVSVPVTDGNGNVTGYEPEGFVSDWANTDSLVFQHYLNKILIPLMENCVDHPAISSWDMFNELNMKVEFNNTPSAILDSSGNPDPWYGTKKTYSKPLDTMTKEQMIQTFENVKNEIVSRDPHGRMITTGNNGRLTSVGDMYSDWDQHVKDINASVDTITVHQYRGHHGNRDYTSLATELTMLRKIGASVNKPLVLQEVGAHNPIYQSNINTPWGPSIAEQAETICNAVYESGTQLTYWWFWKDTGNKSDFEIHPNHTYKEYSNMLDIIKRWNRKLRQAEYRSPGSLNIPVFSENSRPTGVIESDGTGRVEIDVSTLTGDNGFSDKGFTMSFWMKPTALVEGNWRSVISRTDSAKPDSGSNQTTGVYFGMYPTAWNVEFNSKDLLPDTSSIIGVHKGTTDANMEWTHVVIQADYDDTLIDGKLNTSHGLTVFLNGKRSKSLGVPSGKTYTWPDVPLVLFDHNTSSTKSKLKLSDLIIFGRRLTYSEVNTLFLHNRIPSNAAGDGDIAVARWTFENGNLQDSIGGITATTTGSVTFSDDWQPPSIPY